MIRTIYQCDRCGLTSEVNNFTTIWVSNKEGTEKQEECMLCPDCYKKMKNFILEPRRDLRHIASSSY